MIVKCLEGCHTLILENSCVDPPIDRLGDHQTGLATGKGFDDSIAWDSLQRLLEVAAAENVGLCPAASSFGDVSCERQQAGLALSRPVTPLPTGVEGVQTLKLLLDCLNILLAQRLAIGEARQQGAIGCPPFVQGK